MGSTPISPTNMVLSRLRRKRQSCGLCDRVRFPTSPQLINMKGYSMNICENIKCNKEHDGSLVVEDFVVYHVLMLETTLTKQNQKFLKH